MLKIEQNRGNTTLLAAFQQLVGGRLHIHLMFAQNRFVSLTIVEAHICQLFQSALHALLLVGQWHNLSLSVFFFSALNQFNPVKCSVFPDENTTKNRVLSLIQTIDLHSPGASNHGPLPETAELQCHCLQATSEAAAASCCH